MLRPGVCVQSWIRWWHSRQLLLRSERHVKRELRMHTKESQHSLSKCYQTTTQEDGLEQQSLVYLRRDHKQIGLRTDKRCDKR